MKQYFIQIIICLVFVSCQKKEIVSKNLPTKIEDKVISEKKYEFDKNSVFGVYQLTDKDFAICIPVQFDNRDLPLSKEYEDFLKKDSLPWIYGKDMKDYKYYDTLHIDRLIYNKRFENVFRKKMKDSLFVYGTKSGQLCKIKKVVFQSNDCGNDYIAYILDFNQKISGNPLIASEKEIPLNYNNDNSGINPKIKKFAAKESTETMYGVGKYNPIIFSNYNHLYFTYYDDFKWYNKDSGSDCQFPERAVFEVDPQGKIKILWSSEMDLLGLPCL